MRKPWEEAGSHRDDFGFEDRPRRSDRRFDNRDGFKRRSDRRLDRREDGFGRRDDNFARRDKRRDDRRGGFSKRRDDFTDNLAKQLPAAMRSLRLMRMWLAFSLPARLSMPPCVI